MCVILGDERGDFVDGPAAVFLGDVVEDGAASAALEFGLIDDGDSLLLGIVWWRVRHVD